METYIPLKPLVDNPDFIEQRCRALEGLTDDMADEIDEPIVDLVRNINNRTYCFTLQSCFGHFLWYPGQDPHNLDPLPPEPLPAGPVPGPVEYRIAYLAFCIDNIPAGREFLEALEIVPRAAPGFIQYGCAEWFRERQINSYILQVEPERFRDRDRCILEYGEAREVERARGRFFDHLRKTAR